MDENINEEVTSEENTGEIVSDESTVNVKKKKSRKEKKEEHKSKYPNKLAFFLGFIVLLFAVIGVVLIVVNSVSYLNKDKKEVSEYAKYNTYITPVAAVDPDSFDDISKADTKQLINAAIWSILSNSTTPDTYTYQGGYMIIPEADVKSAYSALFSPETASSLTFETVTGYNYEFTYDSDLKIYKIPITTIIPIYTPSVTDVKKSGDSIVITVSYLSTESWAKDSDGNYVAPDADKVMKYTLRQIQNNYYISAIQTVSSTIPEKVEVTTAPQTEKQTETAVTVTETTTAKRSEKVTLGGRVG